MGLNLKPLTIREKTKLESFSSKVIAIDAYNAIYQFLAIIRGPDGMHLTDTSGMVTSHLSGLFYRNINFLSIGIKPVYVFDGKPPSLKSAEISRRKPGANPFRRPSLIRALNSSMETSMPYPF